MKVELKCDINKTGNKKIELKKWERMLMYQTFYQKQNQQNS